MTKILLFLSVLFCVNLNAQHDMTNVKLDAIYTTISDSIQADTNRWQFYINDVVILSLTDEGNNRMRIISPIAKTESLNKKLLEDCLTANFHTALDVKYAISDGILWSVFIHPLKDLSITQVKDAVSQVYYANINFGSSFASTSLVFPGNSEEEEKEDIKEQPKKI